MWLPELIPESAVYYVDEGNLNLDIEFNLPMFAGNAPDNPLQWNVTVDGVKKEVTGSESSSETSQFVTADLAGALAANVNVKYILPSANFQSVAGKWVDPFQLFDVQPVC